MRVAICVPIDLSGLGGVETHVLDLARALRRQGLEVDVFGATDGPGYQGLTGCDPLRYEIIHTHGSAFAWRFIRWAIKHQLRSRHVHTLHGFALGYLRARRAWLNWRCYRSAFIEFLCTCHAGRVIAVSRNAKKQACEWFRLHSDKIEVIPNGYTPNDNPGSHIRQRIRTELGLSEENTVLLFVGRGEDRVKGTAKIATAVDSLYKKYPQIRLAAIRGSGFDDAPWLCRVGRIAHEHIQGYYQAADVFVNASIYEGLPLTLIEAMGASLAIVAAPVGGIPEVIEHEKNALLTTPDRSNLAVQIERLVQDNRLREKLGKNAQQSGRQLTWENIAHQTIKIYESLVT